MTVSPKALFFFLLSALLIWFLYAERAILSPFVLAAVFAYLFNPIISFFSEKLRIPRTIAIFVVYGVIIGLFIFVTLQISHQVFEESSELRIFATHTLQNAKTQLAGLPDWARPTAYQLLTELQKSRFLTFFTTPSLFPFVSEAISRIISFFIFLFSGFYFLKDGGSFFKKFIRIVPIRHKENIENLLREINVVLSKYLRGQIFLIALMSIVTYIALSIIGVRFAVSVAIFSGFAEVVPVIGPIIAGAVAVGVVLITGQVHFGFSPLNAAIIIAFIYFALRHLEDYFVIPHIMGKITKLPPFVIFFAVVAGGHIAGILGLILAVPFAAITKLVLEFLFQRLHENGSRK
ncbi:MAG TPA: AI-2E family transporter [Patescibacteria group bacterium]|nr:AI-2E family transporter [Patescibacteria group bacterium]